MKKLKIILLLSALAMSLSCYKIRNALNSTPEPTYSRPNTNLPKNIENATPDSHMWEKKAVVVSMPDNHSYYVGADQYPIDALGDKISRMFTENPSERSLVYMNIDINVDFGDAAKVLDATRKIGPENYGLMVYRADRAVGTDIGVLKVKIPAEPQPDDDMSTWTNRQYVRITKDGKIFFSSIDAKGNEKLDKTETKEEELGSKISQMLSGKDDKALNIKPSRSTRYIDVVRLINTALGAGASTVFLEIDDMND